MDESRTFDILNYNYLMGNLSILKRIPKAITEQYKELKNITLKLPRTWKLPRISKLPRTAGSISFKKKVLNHSYSQKKLHAYD